LGLPHWLMLAGALLVIAGCLGLAISRKPEIDDEPVNEPSPEHYTPADRPPLGSSADRSTYRNLPSGGRHRLFVTPQNPKAHLWGVNRAKLITADVDERDDEFRSAIPGPA
jgi:hypothetical protein